MPDANIPLDISLLAGAYAKLKSQGVQQEALNSLLEAIGYLAKKILTKEILNTLK